MLSLTPQCLRGEESDQKAARWWFRACIFSIVVFGSLFVILWLTRSPGSDWFPVILFGVMTVVPVLAAACILVFAYIFHHA